MEILIFVLVISNLNLVLTEDVAIDNTVPPEDNYKARTAPEENHFLNDQVAESSQSITQPYGNAAANDGHSQIQDQTQNHVQLPEKLIDGFRHNAIALTPIQVLQPGLHREYIQPQQQTQQLYLQQYPAQQIQIFGAEALPLQQTHGDQGPQALGYSSYVEHVSEKDEDEINSALKDGSVGDIKRLVPKSGITFKIYQNDKSLEKQNPESQSNPITHFGSKSPAHVSVLHHRIRGELPAFPLTQTQVYQPAASLSDAGEQHHGSEYSQQLLQSHQQVEQGVNAQAVYYTQPAQQTAVNVKSSSFAKPHFKTNVAESNYNQQTTGAELQRNLKPPGKNFKQSLSEASSQKQWTFSGKTDGFQRKVKPVKTVETLHYAVDPLIQADDSSPVGYNFNKHKTENSFVETEKYNAGNYLSNSYVPKTSQNNFADQFANASHSEQKLELNRLPGNYLNAEGIKAGHVAHLGTTASTDNSFNTDSETAKSGQHGLISDAPKSFYVEIKNSQNFDHQKALEGSTPFDIKNAIDSSGSFLHQTNYITPTTEIHPLENIQKQQLTYVVPKVPTSTVLFDKNTHDTVAEGHQIKDFGHVGVSPQVAYPIAAEVPGKFLHTPQTFLWTSQHLKQGNVLTSKDLHQQLLPLPLSKDEVYVKTSNAEFPLGVLSHVSLLQQKQPLAFHYDLPIVKAFPQEIHFQPKTKVRIQPNRINHFKLAQPVTIDWSLFKSASSNFGTTSLGMKPELVPHVGDSGKKKIVPILVRRRKNRSNSKHEVGVVYGKVNGNRRPTKPNHHQEKNLRGNALTEVNGGSKKQLEARGERKNEFSVSASYKVERSSKSS